MTLVRSKGLIPGSNRNPGDVLLPAGSLVPLLSTDSAAGIGLQRGIENGMGLGGGVASNGFGG